MDDDELAKLKSLHVELLDHLDQLVWSPRYIFWRFFNHVSRPKNRHSIALPWTPSLVLTLDRSIGRVRLLLNQILPDDSPLVEVSSIVSLPGSVDQMVHSDIPYSLHQLLITGFVALEDVTLEQGPTRVFPRTHSFSFWKHRNFKTAPQGLVFSADGEVEAMQPAYFEVAGKLYEQMAITSSQGAHIQAQSEAAAAPDRIESPDTSTSPCGIERELITGTEPVPNIHSPQDGEVAMLKAGDILLFDTRIFHQGTANVSQRPRALLSFSFQRRDLLGQAKAIDGFTYHIHQSFLNKFSLGDFKPS